MTIKAKRDRTKNFLPNGCWYSTPKVTPQNWLSKEADTSKDWSIHYRYYDPKITDAAGKIKSRLVIFKGMNETKELAVRRQICKSLLAAEMERLKFEGYNPVQQAFIPTDSTAFPITPHTPFIKALRLSLDRLDCVKETRYDIKSVIDGVEKAAMALNFYSIPVSQVTRKYFTAIFDKCRQLNKRFSNNRQNMYRAYLIKLYKIIVSMEAVEAIPLRDIEKKKVIREKRKIPNQQELIKIDDFLHKHSYRYWRFMHLFYAGGARKTEMMNMRGADVNLLEQKFYVLTLKGASHRKVMHTIKTNVLHLWEEALQGCDAKDYIFSTDLKPGPTKVNADTINRKWNKWVKEGLKIDVDFYALKYIHTSQVAKLKGEEVAAGHDGHTTTAMVRNIYFHDREEELHKEMKDLNNTLTGS